MFNRILVIGKTVQGKGHRWEFSLLSAQLFDKSKIYFKKPIKGKGKDT